VGKEDRLYRLPSWLAVVFVSAAAAVAAVVVVAGPVAGAAIDAATSASVLGSEARRTVKAKPGLLKLNSSSEEQCSGSRKALGSSTVGSGSGTGWG